MWSRWAMVMGCCLLLIVCIYSMRHLPSESSEEIKYEETNYAEELETRYKTPSTISMTDEEIRLLSYCYADTERIVEGKLFDYQLEALYQLRAAMGYMLSKYPDCNYTFSGFEPATWFTTHSTLWLNNFQYSVQVGFNEEGLYVCADNFYATVLRDEYAKYLESILAEHGVEAVTYTSFPEAVMLDGVRDLTVEQLLEEYPKLTRNTSIYLGGVTPSNDFLSDIARIIKSERIYGGYTVYYTAQLSMGLDYLREHELDYPYYCFSCFDI